MEKQDHFIRAASLIVLCIFFTGVCRAAEPTPLEQQAEAIKLLIAAQDYISAEAAITQLREEYANHPDLSWRLHEIGCKYAEVGEIDRYRSMSEQVAVEFPESEASRIAQLYLARIAVATLIDQKDDVGAEAAISRMQSDFAGHPDLSWRLHEIGCKYAEVGKMDLYRSMCEQVAADFPESEGGRIAQLYLSRCAIEGLISQKNYAEADAAILQVQSDFAGHPDLPLRLHEIGHKYAQAGYVDKFVQLYEFIKTQDPFGAQALQSQCAVEGYLIKELIESGDYPAAGAKIAALLSDAAENPYVPEALYTAAAAYLQVKAYSEAQALYWQILQGYPDSEQGQWAEIKGVLLDILPLIDAGNMDGAQAATEQLITDFAGDVHLPDALMAISEQYYMAGMKKRMSGPAGATEADACFQASIVLLEDQILPLGENDPNTMGEEVLEKPVFDDNFTALIGYMLGLNYWYLGQWLPAADGFRNSFEADPNHPFAGETHWLVSDCYEKLKAANEVDADEADAVIEWGYQTLFDVYPNCPIVEYAARRLLEINLARGRPASACVYVNWLLDRAHENDGQFAEMSQI